MLRPDRFSNFFSGPFGSAGGAFRHHSATVLYSAAVGACEIAALWSEALDLLQVHGPGCGVSMCFM